MDPPDRRRRWPWVVALCVGLTFVVVLAGWSADPTVKALETLAVVGAVAAVLFGLFGLIALCVALLLWRAEDDYPLPASPPKPALPLREPGRTMQRPAPRPRGGSTGDGHPAPATARTH